MLQERIAKRIRELCSERGWTVYQLMKKCEASKNSVYNAVNGKARITVATLEAICKSLNVSLGEFFRDGETDDIHISRDEKETIVRYRSLNERQRLRVEGYMRAMLEEKMPPDGIK